MSLLAVILCVLGSAVLAGLAIGLLVWLIADRIDDQQDAIQWRINRLENRFAAAGATWFAEVLESAVIGDEEELARRIAEFFEADDTTGFFLDKIAVPCALFAIRESAEYYPEHMAKLKSAMAAAEAGRAATT